MIYLDSAALVKLVHREAASGQLREWLADRPRTPRVTSALAEVEVARAVRRTVPDAAVRVAPVLAAVTRLEITAPVRALAAALGDPLVRSLDAIHLATALRLGEELTTFVTYDERLLAAAADAGLPTAAPGT